MSFLFYIHCKALISKTSCIINLIAILFTNMSKYAGPNTPHALSTDTLSRGTHQWHKNKTSGCPLFSFSAINDLWNMFLESPRQTLPIHSKWHIYRPFWFNDVSPIIYVLVNHSIINTLNLHYILVRGYSFRLYNLAIQI